MKSWRKLFSTAKKTTKEIFMPDKTFQVHHEDGKSQFIKGKSAEVIRDDKGRMTAVKIGRRTIENPIMLTEVLEKVEPKPRKPVDDDAD